MINYLQIAPRESTSRSVQVVALSVVFVVVAAILPLLRNVGPPLIDILYAEDGTEFWSTAVAGGLAAIWTPYAGYLHVAPRLASALITTLPIGWVAVSYTIGATAQVASLALYVFFRSAELLESWPSRALLAIAIVLPPLGGETVGNLANLHWYLIFAAFWATISPPPSRMLAFVGALVAGLAALSNPLAALLLPGAVLAAVRSRSGSHAIVVGALGMGLAIQLVAVLGAEQLPGAESHVADLPVLYAFRVGGGTVIGDLHLTTAWQLLSWSLPLLAIALLAALATRAITTTKGWKRTIVALAVSNSVLFLAIPLLLRGTTTLLPVAGEAPLIGAGRYMVVPGLFVMVCVAVLLDRALCTPTLGNVAAGGVAAIWLLVVITANFSISPLPNGPSWGQGLEDGRNRCLSEQTELVEIAIAPNPLWKVEVPCAELLIES